MKLFRSGIFEYDKQKPKAVKSCARCGCEIGITGGKKFCLPCYGLRYEENIAKNRHKYRGRVYGAKKAAAP